MEAVLAKEVVKSEQSLESTTILERLGLKTPSKEMIILSSLIALLQVLDGVLTAIGISHFGTAAEANGLIRILMERFGYVPALITVKSFALVVIVALCYLSGSVPWLKKAMQGIAVIYLGAAIIPWSAVLISKVWLTWYF